MSYIFLYTVCLILLLLSGCIPVEREIIHTEITMDTPDCDCDIVIKVNGEIVSGLNSSNEYWYYWFCKNGTTVFKMEYYNATCVVIEKRCNTTEYYWLGVS